MTRAAVLTISDSAHQGTRVDTSGPAVAARLEENGFVISTHKIIPDERDEIAAELRDLADSGVAAIIVTTGGTGVALRDITPEATRDVIDRAKYPASAKRCAHEGLSSTRFAPALHVRWRGREGRCLIVNRLRDRRGVRSSLSMLFLELVPHVLELLDGHTGHAADSHSHDPRKE